MSDSDYKDAVDGLRALRPTYTARRQKVTGYLNTDGTVNPDPTTDAVVGNLWVHGYPRGAPVQVLIGPNINPHVPNARVWVGQNDARQAVAFDVVVDKNAIQQWGPGLGAIAPQLNIPAMALIPGRAQVSELGGLFVHVNGFDYDGGFFAGGVWAGGSFDATAYDFDVSADVPSTDGYSVWVSVYFDPADTALHSVAGTPIYTGNNVWTLDEATIADIPIPAGCYPTGAVGLTFGQSSLAGAYFASNRYFLGRTDLEPIGWRMTHDVTLPAGHDFTVVGTVNTGAYSLTVNGALWILG